MTQLRDIRGDHVVYLPVTAMAGATTDKEQAGFVAPYNATITGVKWLPAAAVTADAANYSTLSLRNRGSGGAGTALAATRAYSATDSSAWVPEDCTLSGTTADLEVTAGDALTVQMLHTGTGIALPAGIVQVSYRVR